MCSTFRHGFASPKSRLYTSKAEWEQKAANIPKKVLNVLQEAWRTIPADYFKK